ncbi:hypothetical protein M3Y94_01277900 [Aphelenchoides besseyi]|nr:hypothetical protein M3Y94_01277900 [Aphelenchoides besseyi]
MCELLLFCMSSCRKMSFLRPVLYGSWSSSCTWRVRCALHHKRIEFDVQPMAKDDLRSAEFQRLNPFGQIPIFIHGKNILTESLAIMDFFGGRVSEYSETVSERSFRKSGSQVTGSEHHIRYSTATFRSFLERHK